MKAFDRFELAYRRFCDTNGMKCDGWGVSYMFKKYTQNPALYAGGTEYPDLTDYFNDIDMPEIVGVHSVSTVSERGCPSTECYIYLSDHTVISFDGRGSDENP